MPLIMPRTRILNAPYAVTKSVINLSLLISQYSIIVCIVQRLISIVRKSLLISFTDDDIAQCSLLPIDTSIFTYIVRALVLQSYGVRDITWTFLRVPACSSFSYLSFILLSFSFSFRYINTRILYGENLRPPKRIVAPFSVWPLAVLPVLRCLVIIPGSDTDIGCVDTLRKMPWILSVFEIRTRTDSIESWWLRRIPSTSHFALSLLSFSRLFILYVHPCIYKYYQRPSLLLCSLTLFPTPADHLSNRPFPFLLLSTQLSSHVLCSSVLSDPDIAISFTFLAKAIRRQRSENIECEC